MLGVISDSDVVLHCKAKLYSCSEALCEMPRRWMIVTEESCLSEIPRAPDGWQRTRSRTILEWILFSPIVSYLACFSTLHYSALHPSAGVGPESLCLNNLDVVLMLKFQLQEAGTQILVMWETGGGEGPGRGGVAGAGAGAAGVPVYHIIF